MTKMFFNYQPNKLNNQNIECTKYVCLKFTYTIDLVFKTSKSDPSQSLIHLIPNYCKCRKTKKK